MTNIYEAYLKLSPSDLNAIRDMFFSEFKVAETTLQRFLQSVSQPKNKYVKFFSILLDIPENLSPIVMACQLSREYRPFEFKEYKAAAKVRVEKIFAPVLSFGNVKKEGSPKSGVAEAKASVGLRDQARRNQVAARQERAAQRQQQAEHDAQYR